MTTDPYAFLDCHSDTAGLIAARDWSDALGSIAGWPIALRNIVALIVRSPIPMVLLWGEDGVLLYNDGYAAFAGDRHPSLLGARVREGWPEIADFNDNVLKVGLAGGVMSLKDQELVLNRSGQPEPGWMDLDYTPVLNDDGRPGGVLCIVVETTARVVAERRMAADEARLRFLDELNRATLASRDADDILAVTARLTARHMGASICAYADMDEDQDGFTIRGDWAAEGSSSIVGHYSLADFGTLAVQELGAGRPLIIHDSLNELPADEAAAFQALGVRATVCMPLVKDGQLTALMAIHQKDPHVWTDEELALIREVTERSWSNIESVRANAALSDSESRYRALFDAIDEGFCIIEFFDGPQGPLSDYVHVEANPAYAKEAGIPDVVGQTLRGLVGAEADAWIARYRPVLVTGQPIRFEQELVETGRWLELAAFRVEPPERKQVAVLFKDLTEKRRAELALRESEAQFRSLAKALPNQVWMAGPDGASYWFNERIHQYAGVKDGELAHDVWRKLIHPADFEGATAAWADAVASGQTYQTELRLRRADGVWRWHQSRAVPLLDEQGLVIRWVGSNTDIDDQKAIADALGDVNAVLETRVSERTEELVRTQDALRQAQKMEAVGQLTGGIAHDFNNLLAGISGSLELIEKRIGEGRTVGLERYIEGAQGAARRAAALTQRLLAFSRRQTLDPKPTDVNRLIAGMEDLIRRSVGPTVEMEVVGAGGLWTTRIDPSQLENALLNLCINARDAMAPEGGRLTIETANKWLDEREARSRDLPPGQYVSLCVTDTGTGMPPDVIERAFDPFFTTKPLGQGTGLGLSMIYGFVRQSGGQVRIYSEVGQGTTMCLYLPRHHGEAEDTVDDTYTVVPPGHGETVLVIDDEEIVRGLIVEVLTDQGYRVVDAPDGVSGLRMLESIDLVDLLVTDVGLPGGMNGRQVADAARTLRPGLKVLFVTGYAENAAVGNGHLEPGMQVITKPFQTAAIVNKVRDMIDGR